MLSIAVGAFKFLLIGTKTRQYDTKHLLWDRDGVQQGGKHLSFRNLRSSFDVSLLTVTSVFGEYNAFITRAADYITGLMYRGFTPTTTLLDMNCG